MSAKPRAGLRSSGFSLVEVAVALGVATFALVSLMALLPVGIKTNQISSEETRASLILGTLEADLRNTHPLARSDRSNLFGLALPYQMDPAGTHIVPNTRVALDTVGSAYSVGLNDDETPVAYSSDPPARYQASVIYTQVPGAGSATPIHARLIVNWPAVNTTDPAKLTSLKSVRGYVETYVTFPAP